MFLAHGLQFVVEAVTKYLERIFGSDGPFSGVPRTLVITLRGVALCAIFLGAPTSASSLHFHALWRLRHFLSSRITTKTQCIRGLPVRPRNCRSRFEPGDYVLPFWKVYESNHRLLTFSTQICHEALESIIPVDIETPIYCSLDETRVFSSASMTFLLEQGLEIEVGSVTPEKASLRM